MTMPQHHPSNHFLDVVAGRLVRHFLYRTVTAPVYLLAIVPWILVLFSSTPSDSTLSQLIFQVIRYLAGQPSGADITEADLVRAAAVLLLLVNVIFEVVWGLLLKKRQLSFILREFLAKVALSVSGWITFVLIYWFSKGELLMSAFITMVVLSLLFFAFELCVMFGLTAFVRLLRVNLLNKQKR